MREREREEDNAGEPRIGERWEKLMTRHSEGTR
jgi:hypothetical protein